MTGDDLEFPDETLDGASAPEPVTPDQKSEVMRQRFVHGMLRALYSQDPDAREARVGRVLAGIGGPGLGGRFSPLRHPFAAAAGLLVLGALVASYLVFLYRPVPRVDALMARAMSAHQMQVDRRYEVIMQLRDESVAPMIPRRLDVTLRPGHRFLVETRSRFGAFRAGCDGTTLWLQSGMLPEQVLKMPLADAPLLNKQLGGAMDVGYFDLEWLLGMLPKTCTVTVIGREGDGLVRVQAEGIVGIRDGRLRSAVLLVRESSGVIERLEIDTAGAQHMASKVVFSYLGEVVLDPSEYAVPK